MSSGVEGGVDIRPATERDIEAIAALHTDSWRRHYRGAFSDAYLDGDVLADRRSIWTERLTTPDPANHTVVAVDGGEIVGLAHTILDDDADWGALLDNLHVAHRAKRTGIGTRLMARSAAAVLARGKGTGLYLWVLEGNIAAQAFYDARGGRRVDRAVTEPPGRGGAIVGVRYVWPDPSVLLVA